LEATDGLGRRRIPEQPRPDLALLEPCGQAVLLASGEALEGRGELRAGIGGGGHLEGIVAVVPQGRGRFAGIAASRRRPAISAPDEDGQPSAAPRLPTRARASSRPVSVVAMAPAPFLTA